MTAIFTSEHAQKAVLGWYADGGHGWLAVDIDASEGFPDAERKASQYSYVDHQQGVVYLEEDEDAPRFIKQYGIDVAGLPDWYVDGESEIRNLPRGNYTL